MLSKSSMTVIRFDWLGQRNICNNGNVTFDQYTVVYSEFFQFAKLFRNNEQ